LYLLFRYDNPKSHKFNKHKEDSFFMILGTIVGKITTNHFTFHATGDPKKFEYVQVMHKSAGFVLCQIVELTRQDSQVLASCIVIGYKQDGKIKSLREPFDAQSEVLRAQDDFIKDIVKLEGSKMGAYVGKLEGRDINVYLDLQTLLTKHVSVLAKSGAGKSYCVGVLIEEIILKKVPILVIDPHGEYDTLQFKTEQADEKMHKFGISPTGFGQFIQIYGDNKLHDVRPLAIPDKMTSEELIQMLPSKISATQEGLLYSVMKNAEKRDFDEILFALEGEESQSKWQVIKLIESLKATGIFSKSPISYNELLQSGKCSVINFKGIAPPSQEVIVYKILKDLFELRKLNKVPPFFCVIEEAHNYCPERGFGQTICSQIIRTIASEGRKFGMGLAVISQRPARVDKSVLSQVSTQVILKVTNPNDLKAISSSVEGLTGESEQEIQNLSIGHALITGVVDVPLFIEIRPRMTKHGGQSVNMLTNQDPEFFDQLKEFESQELLPIIRPPMSKKDVALTVDDAKKVKTGLIPALLCKCDLKGDQFSLLIELVNGSIITNLATLSSKKLPDFAKLTQGQLRVLQQSYALKTFTLEKFMQTYGGLGGLDVSKDLDALVTKKYLMKLETKYAVSETYVLTDLKNVATYEKIQYVSIHYDKKMPARVSVDEAITLLQRFCTVLDKSDCFVVKYGL
jgi:uncharacterized protein